MSQSSGNPSRARWAFAPRFAASMAAVAAIIALAVGPTVDRVADLSSTADLHAPDFSHIAALSLPIKIHLATALAALALGGVLMALRKGRRFHCIAGWTWVSLVSVTAGATLFITSLNHGSWSLLHLFTAWTFIVLPFAVWAAKRRQVSRHRRLMMGLFYGGFAINLGIAFIPGRTLWMTFLG